MALATAYQRCRRLKACNVKNTILFFGSARARSREDHAAATKAAQATLASEAAPAADKAAAGAALARLQRSAWMCDVYEQIAELAALLTRWSMGRVGPDGNVPYVVSTGS
jgi:hypothetical protein